MAEDTYFSARNMAEFVASSPEKDLLVSHLEMLKQSQTAATGLAAFLHTTSPTSPPSPIMNVRSQTCNVQC